MKKVLSFLWSILEFVIIVYVIVMTSILLSKNKYGLTKDGFQRLSFLSKSKPPKIESTKMLKVIQGEEGEGNYWTCFDLVDERGIQGVKAGDLLIVKNSNDIKVGDVIYYYVVYNESYVVQNAPVTDIQADKYSAVYTIDDEEGSLTISSARVLGKYNVIYHKFGKILDVLESRLGFLFLVLLPILVIFIYQVYELIMIFRYEKVDEEEQDKRNNKFKIVEEEKSEESV